MPDQAPTLRRTLGLPVLTIYGVGTMVGGGFYALLGKITGEAGMAAPFALLLTAIVALLTALSFSEMARRYPSSAGEARYVAEGFKRAWLAAAVGWAVVATGVVSAATLADAFAGFLTALGIDLPPWVGEGALVLALAAIAAWGVGQTALVAVIITAIEVGGLIVILAARAPALAQLPARAGDLLPDLTLPAAGAVLSAAFLAFYAFIGFEDMVNMAEEVKHPKRTLPRAILLAMIITTALYILVALIAVLSVPTDDLAAAEAPLSLLLGGIAGPRAIILISMLAGVNGALVQIVMASRVMYGMATRRGAPRWLGAVHPATQTPVRATIVAALVVALLAWWLPLESLARITSAIILGVFALVHASLIRIRFRAHHRPGGLPRTLIPVAGLASCFVMLAAAAARLF